MAYNSIHKGPQIDQAITSVLTKETTWDEKADVPKTRSITLLASGWLSSQQSISVDGVKATGTDQLI